MNVNYYVKCRICGAKTRIRIPVGHLDEYPINVACGNCGSDLRGTFHIYQEEVRYEVDFTNCDLVEGEEASFFAEVSGDLICNKVEKHEKKI